MLNTLILSSIVMWTTIASLCGQGLKTIAATQPKKSLTAIHEDELYKLVSCHYGRHSDPGGNTEPGLFVYSKAEDKWLQITEISTVDGVFGKSWSSNREDMKKLMMISVGWDHTGLAKQPYAEIPLHTSGSICFPEIVLWEKGKKRYKLSFLTTSGVKSAATTLYLKAEDLMREFTKPNKQNKTQQGKPR